MNSRRFFLIFVLFLVALSGAFWWIVQEARAVLPQEGEVLTLEEAAQLLETGEIERALLQEERDVFLYRSGQNRPLYTRLESGRTFTETFGDLGVPAASLPPLRVEE